MQKEVEIHNQRGSRVLSLSDRLEFYCPSKSVYQNAIVLGNIDNDADDVTTYAYSYLSI